MNGRSRSRERTDRFGRVVPSGESKSRSKSRDRDRHRRRSRSPHRQRRRSRSRDRSSSASRPRRTIHPLHPLHPLHTVHSAPTTNRTNIEDPKFLNARVFIGNLPADKVTKEELESTFELHGKILGVSVHDKGFGFVQFEREEDARTAVEVENGSRVKGSVLDVKMAAEGRNKSRGERGGRPMGAGHDRTPYDRDNHSRPHPPPPPPGGPRDRMTPPTDPYAADPYRDPYPRRDPVREPPGPPRRDDPYYGDPYRRPPPPDDYVDRYRDDPYRRPPPPDPYRREPPFDDPYRDPYYREPYGPPPPPKKPVPPDVQIICMNTLLRQYAERIEARLREGAMISEIVIIPEDVLVPQMVEDASRKDCLFAIIINSQNEIHKSLTLNILHGTPQEHRNMPLDDAMTLVVSSFEGYIKVQREKTAPPAAPVAPAEATPPATTVFVPPSSDISYLLNLLADNRQLTLEELEKVIEYLSERKNKILVSEGGRTPAPAAAAVSTPRAAPVVTAASGNTSTGDSTTSFLQQQQQELQAKILSILNGSGSSPTGVPSAAPVNSQAVGQSYGVQSTTARNPTQNASQSQGGSNSLINFDNPNVQKALDNLIQSGPGLLKGVSASSGQTRGSYPGTAQQARPQAAQQQYVGGQMAYQQGAMGGMQASGGQRMMGGAAYSGQQTVRPMGARNPQQGVRPRF